MQKVENTTFIIKTFERPGCLDRLLQSIRKFYPDMPIVIADDSEEHYPEISKKYEKTTHHCLPFNMGLSAGRNFLVDNIHSDFVILLDDDFVFSDDTNVEKLVKLAENYDIAAGAVRNRGKVFHYEGDLQVVDGTLHLLRKILPKPGQVDIAFNFFAARVKSLKRVYWDPYLKMAEHADFFWRAKQNGLKVGYHPEVIVGHLQERPTKKYKEYRKANMPEYERYFIKKSGFRAIMMAEDGPERQMHILHNKDQYEDDITIVAATTMRPDALRDLLQSVNKYTPKTKVIIGDNSPIHYPEVSDPYGNVTHLCLEPMSGLTHSLVECLKHVKTKYVVRMDDDVMVTPYTDLSRMALLIDETPYDIICGMLIRNGEPQEFCGKFYWDAKSRELEVAHIECDQEFYIHQCDIGLNFHMSLTEDLRNIHYDRRLTINEHLDHFLRYKKAGYSIGRHRGITAMHNRRQNPEEYKDIRHSKSDNFLKMGDIMLRNWNINRVTGTLSIERIENEDTMAGDRQVVQGNGPLCSIDECFRETG